MSLRIALCLTLGLAGMSAESVAQLGFADFEWTLHGGSYGTAEIDAQAETLFLLPTVNCFCNPNMRFEAVAPANGMLTVGVTTLAPDAPWDSANYWVGDASTVITTGTIATSIQFEVFRDVPFALGTRADDYGGSLSVTYHSMVFEPLIPTPQVSQPLDVRHERRAQVPASSFASLKAIGDVDGDGVVDLAYSGVDHSVDELLSPSALHHLSVLSGADRSLVWSHDGPYVGDVLSDLGDLDLDGVPDVVAGASGRLLFFSGVDGVQFNEVWTTDLGVNSFTGVASAGDINSDGHPDFWVTSFDELLLVSGRSLVPIDTLAFPGGSQTARNTECLARLEDVDGDGFDDVIVGVSSQQSLPGTLPRVLVVSGATRAILMDAVGAADTWLGFGVGDAGDVNGDGIHDVLAGAPRAANGAGEVLLWSGATGALIHSMTGQRGSGLGASSVAAGDVNSDGFGDILLGSFAEANLISQPENRVELRSGLTGEILHDFVRPSHDRFGRTLLGDVDLNLDGELDLVVASWSELNTGALHIFSDLSLAYGAASLSAVGSLQANTSLEVDVVGGPPSASAYFVMGFTSLNLPFMGGVLVPAPDVVIPGLPLDAAGSLHMAGTWPSGVPAGLVLAAQVWTPDAQGPVGFGSTNGVLFFVP